MRLSFHLGASQLTFLFLALLCPIPRTVTTYPQTSTALLPTVDGPELESALQHLQAVLQNSKDPVTIPGWPQDHLSALLEPREEEEGEKDEPWKEGALLRSQRGDFMDLPLSPFPGDNSLESIHYQDGGEGEDGWKRNDALTSMAGGLQAVSREKGGFGFRFGRKRWTERGRLDGGVRRGGGGGEEGDEAVDEACWEFTRVEEDISTPVGGLMIGFLVPVVRVSLIRCF